MDSVIFQAMAVELDRVLANSRLDRVIQVSAGTLVLRFWTGREKVQLLLKADGQGAFHLTRQAHAAPATPPRFCQLLRARLRRLVAVRAEPLDRIVHLPFIGPDQEPYDLILEAFGAQGNLLLVDAQGRIVDLLWRQPGPRTLLPGQPYLLPPQQERCSLFADQAHLLTLIGSVSDPSVLARLAVAPMSPALARAICFELAAGRPLETILDHLRQVFAEGRFTALRVAWDGHRGQLPVPLGRQGFNTVETCRDLSALLDEVPTDAGQEPTGDLTARLTGLLARQRKKLVKRMANIADECARQLDPAHYRIMGELLLTNLRLIRRGEPAVEVEDYYQSPPVKISIPLDSKLSPRENAERYFKQYRKARRAGEHHQRRQRETEQELARLDQIELALEETVSADDLYQVQLELQDAGLLKQTKGQLGRRQAVRIEDQLHRATTPAGWQLYWGKNSKTNDHVSRNLTGPHDLWFHANGMPGAHLVLKCGERSDQVAEADLLYAAALAAGYSKGKDAGKVEVIVTSGREVKKPKSARPGLVTVDQYRTVMVAPMRLE